MRTLTRQALLSTQSVTKPQELAKRIARRYPRFIEYTIGDQTVFARSYNESEHVSTLCLGYSLVDQIADIQFTNHLTHSKHAQFIETNIISIDDALDSFFIQWNSVIMPKDLQNQ